MNPTILPIVGIVAGVIFWISLMVLLTGGYKKVERMFNWADKRTFISGKETYNKLNQLMDEGTIRLTTYENYDDSVKILLYVTFEDNGNDVECRFEGVDIDDVINQAHAWAVKRGYVQK